VTTEDGLIWSSSLYRSSVLIFDPFVAHNAKINTLLPLSRNTLPKNLDSSISNFKLGLIEARTFRESLRE
jgi:hypothetical protein